MAMNAHSTSGRRRRGAAHLPSRLRRRGRRRATSTAVIVTGTPRHRGRRSRQAGLVGHRDRRAADGGPPGPRRLRRAARRARLRRRAARGAVGGLTSRARPRRRGQPRADPDRRHRGRRPVPGRVRLRASCSATSGAHRDPARAAERALRLDAIAGVINYITPIRPRARPAGACASSSARTDTLRRRRPLRRRAGSAGPRCERRRPDHRRLRHPDPAGRPP